MGNFKEKWNKNKFSIYDSEEKTVLRLIQNIWNFLSSFAVELDNKTDINGDHKGTWQGISKPTMSDEGLRGTVELHTEQIEDLQELVDITPYFIVNKYGILGDGTDETEKLQRAIDENDIIYIPKNYNIGISSSLTFQGSKQILSEGGTLTCLTEGLYRTILIEEGEDIVIEGLTFNMNNKGRTSIDINLCNRYRIENCNFTGYTPSFGWYATDGGIRVDKGTNGIIKNCNFYNHGNGFGTATETLNRCIGLGGTCNNTLVEGCTFTNVSQAIVTDSTNIRIINNYFNSVEDNCIYCVGKSENIIMNNNHFINCLDECIVISGIGDFTISNNQIKEVKNKAIAINGDLKNILIDNNSINCTTSPANLLAWRSDKYDRTVTNFVVTNNNFNVTNTTSNELFSFGNIDGGLFENNNIKVIASNKVIAFRGATKLRWIVRNNIIDNTGGTFTTLLDYPVNASIIDFVFDNCKVMNGRLGALRQGIIKNMRFQNTGSSIYLNNQAEQNILFAPGIPTEPVLGKKGDIVYNTSPTSGGYVGWVCVEGDGTALGTWKGFGTIQS